MLFRQALFGKMIELLQTSYDCFGLKYEDTGTYEKQVPEYKDSDYSREIVEG